MSKTRQERYNTISELAEWVNKYCLEIEEDGMNIIIAIADKEKIWRMCLTGSSNRLTTMLQILLDAASKSFDDTYSS